MRLNALLLSAALSLPVLLESCSACGCSEELQSNKSSEELLSMAAADGLRNASSPEAGLICSGMPTPEQLEQLADQGVAVFINLRAPGEPGTGWEAETAERLGVEFKSLPINGGADITESKARELRSILDAAPRPALLYCGSSNRVGALYGLAAYYVDGVSAEAALDLAGKAGMTRLEPVVRERLGLSEQ
jgi:uncharacterized protein (TIGR01244 family)